MPIITEQPPPPACLSRPVEGPRVASVGVEAAGRDNAGRDNAGRDNAGRDNRGAQTGSHASEPQAAASPLLELRVLIIDDDVEAAETIQRALRRSGMQAVLAHTGADAVVLKRDHSPHVALVDLDLPDVNGEALIRWLVGQRDCGIIVVSGYADEQNRVLTLELGADDYVAKPPNLRELAARVRAVHRRMRERPAPEREAISGQLIPVGDYVVDLHTRQIRDRAGQRIDVTAAEFAVMAALIEAKGAPVSRGRLSELALRRPWRSDDRGVDQLIFGLRQKMAMADKDRRFIQSIRNEGYVLNLPDGP
jgi:DNA-binding response OmpR family regulator